MDIQLTKENLTKWDKYAPIIKQGTTYHVYLTDSINTPDFYNELVHTLTNAKDYEEVRLYLNNGGGVIDSAFYLTDAILHSDAHVIAIVSGTVASAATVITLACDELITTKYLSFMIHNYSTGMQGKGHELKAYQNFTDRELNRAFKEIYKDFLTDEEMEKVIEGTDIWLNEEEVEERWAKREQIRLQLIPTV